MVRKGIGPKSTMLPWYQEVLSLGRPLAIVALCVLIVGVALFLFYYGDPDELWALDIDIKAKGTVFYWTPTEVERIVIYDDATHESLWQEVFSDPDSWPRMGSKKFGSLEIPPQFLDQTYRGRPLTLTISGVAHSQSQGAMFIVERDKDGRQFIKILKLHRKPSSNIDLLPVQSRNRRE